MRKIISMIILLACLCCISLKAQKINLKKIFVKNIEEIEKGYQKIGNRQIGIRINGAFTVGGAITFIIPTTKNTRINFDLELNYLNQTGYKYAIKNYNPLIINSIAGSRKWFYISPTVIKDWVFPFSISHIKGFSWYAGVGGTIGLGFNVEPKNNNFYLSTTGKLHKGDDFRFALGVVGNIGVEYSFMNIKKKIPLVLSLDARPTIGYKIPFTAGYGFHPTDVVWGSVGVGIKYLF